MINRTISNTLESMSLNIRRQAINHLTSVIRGLLKLKSDTSLNLFDGLHISVTHTDRISQKQFRINELYLTNHDTIVVGLYLIDEDGDNTDTEHEVYIDTFDTDKIIELLDSCERTYNALKMQNSTQTQNA